MQKFKNKPIYLFIMIAVFLTACDRPDCKNENPVFEKYPPASKEYINELAGLLQTNDAKNISFWFDRYESEEGKEYIVVDINGNRFCAKGKILVTDWRKLAGIQKTKGISYRGAELVGLTIDHVQDSLTSQLVYKNIDHIVD